VDDVNIFQHQLQWVTLEETTHVTDDYSSLLTTSRTYYTWAFQRTHSWAPKFKMADVRHLENH